MSSAQELKLDCIDLQNKITDLELAMIRLEALKLNLNKKYTRELNMQFGTAEALLEALYKELGRTTVKE